MGIIKILDSQTADKIAAGEVIERPLSVVKELLENSLDAKATNIEIEIKEGGISLIAVRDNGLGMDKDDLQIAFMRHATSKIRDMKDLYALNTFGFRGEALASIAAVAQIEMSSCKRGELSGHKISLSGGGIPSLCEIAGTGGTNIEVKNLFYNIPARRKFLKSPSYEAGLIGDLISKYALGHPNIRFKFINNRQVVLDTAGMNTVEDRLEYLYGNIKQAIVVIPKVEFAKGQFLEGYLLRETVSRNNRSQEVFFVNGRLIKNNALSKAMEEGYYTLLPKGRFPIGVLSLTMPGDMLDINIHPAKLEIKIKDFEQTHSMISDIIKDALWQAEITKNSFLLKNYTPKEDENPVIAKSFQSISEETFQNDILVSQIEKQNIDQHIVAEYPSVAQLKKELEHQEEIIPSSAKKNLQKQQIDSAPKQSEHIFEKEAVSKSQSIEMKQTLFNEQTIGQKAIFEASEEEKPFAKKESISVASFTQKPTNTPTIKNLSSLHLIGQLNQSFILAQNEDGLYIVDQHTLHERILYETLLKEENEKQIISESLLIPITLTLSIKQESILIQYIIQLRDLGFVIENFGERSYLIRAVPQGMSFVDDFETFFMDLIEDLNEDKMVSPALLKEKIITQSACKGAIKAKQQLTELEMIELLEKLDQVENAHTCPHGRPIVYKISMKELYSIFKRGTYHE